MFFISIIILYCSFVTGSTYAYYFLIGEDTSSLTGDLGEAGVELTIEKVVPKSNMSLVPLLDDALDNALKGNGGISNCIDSNNNLSCEVYRINISNSGTTNLRLAGDITLISSGNNSVFRNLKWEQLESVDSRKTEYTTNGLGTSRLEHNLYLIPGITKSYYIAVWISENGKDQKDTNKGTFLGKVEFYSNYGTGEGITAFFGEVDESTLSYMKADSSAYFRNKTYTETIKNVAFVYDVDTSNAVETWDMSLAEDKSILAWVEENEEKGYYDLYIGSLKQIYATNLNWFFYQMKNIDSISFDNLDTSMVTNMNGMFYRTGYNSTVFSLDLGDNFNTENVTNMNNMFNDTGRSSTVFTLDLGDKFDTSNVTNMNSMFQFTGYSSTVFTLDLGDNFNTENVTNMDYMYWNTGNSSTVFALDLGEKFDTSNVTSMKYMFANVGSNSTKLTLNLGEKFNTSNVTNMDSMFINVGSNSTKLTLNLGDYFNTMNVTIMSKMFYNVGEHDLEFTLNLGNKFNTSNVKDMSMMFGYMGYRNPNLILDLSTFDFTNVTSYVDMFIMSSTTKTIYVKDAEAQNWILDKGFRNLSKDNVLIKS